MSTTIKIGDRVRRTDPDTGKHKFFDIETQQQLDYIKSYVDTKFTLLVIPVADEAVCIACEG